MYTTLPRDGCVLCMNTLFDVQLEVFPCRRRRRLNLFCQKSTRLSLVTALHLSVFFAFQCKEMQCDMYVHWSRELSDVEIPFRPFKWLRCLALCGAALYLGDLVCWYIQNQNKDDITEWPWRMKTTKHDRTMIITLQSFYFSTILSKHVNRRNKPAKE